MMQDRKQLIAEALGAELARQGKAGIDVQRLTDAVELALRPAGQPTMGGVNQGKSPDELNATNDD